MLSCEDWNSHSHKEGYKNLASIISRTLFNFWVPSYFNGKQLIFSNLFFFSSVVSRDLVKPQFSIPLTGHTLVTVISPIPSFLDFLQPGIGLGHLACWASEEVCRLAVAAMQVTAPAPHHLWPWGLSSMASAAAASAWHFRPLVFWHINPNSLLGSPSLFRTAGKIAILLGEEVYAEHRASSGTQEWGLTATVVCWHPWPQWTSIAPLGHAKLPWIRPPC